jgi:eukaryotic-like serine/threonine-protein kinase
MEMSPEQWGQVKDLYEAALEHDASQRAAFLQRNGTDEVIRKEVLRLLEEHDNVGSFLSTPPFVDHRVPTLQPEARFAPGEVLAERFRIISFIAAGGMGEVYEAEDLVLKDNLAIKTIRPEVLQQNNALARFKREVQLARKVTHPNICRVFDLFWHKRTEGESENVIVFVSMELLRGETLSERIRRAGRFTTAEALPLIQQIASGLDAAHRAEVVHRDLKPGNVILVPDPDNDHIRSVITDFGLALRTGVDANKSIDLTASHGMFGTPAYMAPEQIEGKEVTKQADIYALGLIIYEMVTGEHAFPADTPLASAAKRLSDSLVSPKRFAPELGDNWEQTIARCLRLEPNARYTSAMDVVRALSGDSSDSSAPLQIRVSPRYRRLARISFVLALLFVLAGTAFKFRSWFGKGHPASVHAARRPTVAVLGFKNLSGKPDVAWISPAVSQMLGTELSAGEQMRIIPSEQVAHTKIDLALTNEDTLSHDTLTRVRDNMGSDFVVLGSFLDMEGQVRIDLSLQDAVNGETVANISESGSEQQLPDLTTRAGERLRLKLGVAELSAFDEAHAKASQSSNLVAAKFYSEGLEKLHSFDASRAKDLLEQAVTKDPNYALAHAALAEAWRSLGYDKKSAEEAKKAMDLGGNLSRENRLTIEAQYRNSVHDSAHEADIYKSLFTFYPDNLEYGLLLARSQYFSAQWQEANSTLDALEQLNPDGDDPRIDFTRAAVSAATGDYKKALALAERVEFRAQQTGARRLAAQALQTQCSMLSRLGDPSKARAACDKSKTIFSDIGDYKAEAGVWGDIAFQSGNQGDDITGRMANERQIALLRQTQSDSGLAYAMTVAGELSADLGDYSKALKEYSEALDLYEKIGSQTGIISAYGNLGWVNALQGNLLAAMKNDEEGIALARKTNSKGEMDLWLGNYADALLDKGDVPSATKQLDEGFEINQQTGDKRVRIYLHTSRSRLLLAEGRFDESRREVEMAIKACQELNDEAGAEQRRLILAQLEIAENHPQTAVETLREAVSYFESKKDEATLIEARPILIEALLTMPLAYSKDEIGLLTRVEPNTRNASLRLNANLQIARARAALGDEKGGLDMLSKVISESRQLGYERLFLESRLARAKIELESGEVSKARPEIERVAKQAEAKGLKSISNKAHFLLK